MKILVLGDSGMLGQAIVQHFGQDSSNHVLGLSNTSHVPQRFWHPLKGAFEHHPVDLITETGQTESLIRDFKPDLIVYCVAIVNLSVCEENVSLAEKLHDHIPAEMAGMARRFGSQFVHVSTDMVFDGKKGSSYVEEDACRPVNQYGMTKRSGELSVMKNNPDALILRTNIVGFRDDSSAPTFGEWLLKAIATDEAITLFEDYVNSSMHVEDFSLILQKLVEKTSRGIIHVASQEEFSKYEFGKSLSRLLTKEMVNVKKGRMADLDLTPRRPCYLALNVSKGEKQTGLGFPTLQDTAKKLVRDFKIRRQEEISIEKG